MITRRKIVIALGAGALAPFASFAQQPPAKVFRIGVLHTETEASTVRRGIPEALRAGLSDLGYVEGRNIVFEFRFADGKLERLEGLAAELVALNVDVIVTHSTQGVMAVSRATRTIPIVVQSSSDMVALGVAASLARPGGNVTGSTFFFNELNVKRLELIKEVMPRITQVAVLLRRGNPGHVSTLPIMGKAAKSLKVELQTFEVVALAEFDGAFTAMAKKRLNAVVIPDDPLFLSNPKAIADLATAKHMLSVGSPTYAEAGVTIGYGVDFVAQWRRVGFFVDKILRGAKPGDIPIEQPTKFDFVLNMKTAKSLGIKIPNSVLVRATKVIQ